MQNKEYQRQYRLDNKEKIAAQKKAHRLANKLRYINYDLKRLYNITWDDYYNMLMAQDSACAICGYVPDNRLYIDHNHDTKTVRSLLCSACNAAIGLLHENPVTIRNAAKYIEAHKK